METPDLSKVAETLLIPLYFRAMETQRPDALMKDEQAVALVARLDYDFAQVEKIRVFDGNKVARIMLTREIDRYTRDFLTRYPQSVVIHIGCGLDSRFERVDNGQVEWYDLDLADVAELRRDLLGGEHDRYHLLAGSVLEDFWLDAVQERTRRQFLFLAENVFVYFTDAQVKTLVLKLRDNFPGAELVFDGWTPFMVWLGNLQLSRSKFAGLLRWGLKDGHTLERWGSGIHLLDQWGFFDTPEPRLAGYRWAAPFFRLFKPMQLFHFQLGETPG